MPFPPNNPRDTRNFLAILIFLGLAGLYFQFVFSPKQAELALIQEHVDSLNAMNQRAKAEMAKGTVDDLRAEARRWERTLAQMRQLVPTVNEVPALLEQVSTAARRTGLDLGQVNPEPVISGPQFDTYRYKIGVVGPYHEIGTLLANVGSLTRIVAPMNIDLRPSTRPTAKKRQKKDETLLEATFFIQTYVLREGPPPAAPQPAAGRGRR